MIIAGILLEQSIDKIDMHDLRRLPSNLTLQARLQEVTIFGQYILGLIDTTD